MMTASGRASGQYGKKPDVFGAAKAFMVGYAPADEKGHVRIEQSSAREAPRTIPRPIGSGRR
jgi:hypothetical protein